MRRPENLDEYNALAVKAGREPLRRILLMLDESSSVFQAMGGSTGALAGTLAQLGWRGRKFGIKFVFGAQDISKELIGSIREQVNLSIAFRIKASSALMAKKIGCSSSHRIPANRPGLAIADRFGPMQSYYVPKPMFLAAGASAQEALSELEGKLFTRAWVESEGKLTILNIAEWDECSQHQARKMQSTWAIRGWIAKDGKPAAQGEALAAKTQEVERLQDRLVRLQAEFENYKKRMARENAEFLKFATEGLLLEFLPVLDNLERAIASARAGTANHEAVVEGIDMIARLFRATLEKAGVKPMEAVGKPFDPGLHQAVAQVETPDYDDNVVVAEVQKGYLLEGRVLRAAMVKVSRASSPATERGSAGEDTCE